MNRRRIVDIAVFCGLIGLAVATRMIMLKPNFHAVTAVALFAGFYFRHRAVAVLVPLTAMSISDWFIGGYAREVMLTVYAAMALPVAWRTLLRNRLTAGRVGLTAVASCLIFFVATNAAVWYAGIWYSRGWDGLIACYTAALPFLVNSLAGDLLFSAGIFGAYALALRWAKFASPLTAQQAALVAN